MQIKKILFKSCIYKIPKLLNISISKYYILANDCDDRMARSSPGTGIFCKRNGQVSRKFDAGT